VPDLPGCIAVGDNRDDALRLIREAIGFHLEGLRDAGEPAPVAETQLEVVEVETV
jgi:predicted RNase H-like HicB family nuclease